jgi:membrane fusion protein (multidrug efflux system)
MKHHTAKKAACLALSAFLMTSVLTGCGSDEAVQETVASTIPVTAETVIMQDFEKTVTLGGLTAAENTVNVIAKVNGMEQIKAVNVKVGDKVRAGQVLAVLDSEMSNITLNNAQLQYDNAYTNYENGKQLFELGAVSQNELNQLKMAFENAGNQMRQAQMSVDYATVTAPISGTVTMSNANVGSYATASAPMFEIANVSTLEISTGINEQNVSKIAIGQEVLLRINSVSDQWMSGTITEISKVMNTQTKNYPVTVAMDNKDDALVAGMYAEIEVAVGHADGVLVIPVDAIVYKEAQPVVFIVQEDGTVKESNVTLGMNDGDYYVVESGIALGDQIVIKGNGDLVNGSAVTVVTLDGVAQDYIGDTDEDAAAEDGAATDAADEAVENMPAEGTNNEEVNNEEVNTENSDAEVSAE